MHFTKVIKGTFSSFDDTDCMRVNLYKK